MSLKGDGGSEETPGRRTTNPAQNVTMHSKMRDRLFSYLITTLDARSFITTTFQQTFDDADLSMLNATHLSKYTNQLDKFYDEEIGSRDKDWINLPDKGQIDMEASLVKFTGEKKNKQANKRSGSHDEREAVYVNRSGLNREKNLKVAISMAFMGKNQ